MRDHYRVAFPAGTLPHMILLRWFLWFWRSSGPGASRVFALGMRRKIAPLQGRGTDTEGVWRRCRDASNWRRNHVSWQDWCPWGTRRYWPAHIRVVDVRPCVG